MEVEKSVHWQCPATTADLVEIVRQAFENHLTVKHSYGGRFPVGTEPADVLVSLEKLSRLLNYDPLTQTVTVEPGIGLSDLLHRLEHYDLTLDLPGWIADMSIGDAIATGLPSFSTLVERCTVLLPQGKMQRLEWHKETVPSMQGVLCGLGVMGLVSTSTLRCVPNRRVRESVSVLPVSAVVKQGGANVGTRAHWFPLSNCCVVVRSSEVRLRNSSVVPTWVRFASAVLRACQRCLRLFTAPLVWHFPSLACLASSAALALCAGQARLRSGHCFPAHALVAPSRHCAGIQWVVPANDAENLLNGVGAWAKSHPRHVSTPARLSWHESSETDRRPLLDPGTTLPGQRLVIWLDWFGPATLVHGTCLPMASLESTMQECGAAKCWSAGPAHASALIAAGYHGYQRWQRERRLLDPGASFVSAYVIGNVDGAK